MLVITNETRKPRSITHFDMLTKKHQSQALENFGQDAKNGNYFIYQCQLLNLTAEFSPSHIQGWYWYLSTSAWTGIVINEDDNGLFSIAQYHQYSIDFHGICQKIIDILPHGAGIDAKWDYEQKQHYINFSCSYHMMNEGYYCGWQDFNVRIPLQSFVKFAYGHGKQVLQSFKLTIPNECYRSRMTDLRSYLEDTVLYSFLD